MLRTIRQPYDSDVSDKEWALIRPFIPPHPPRGNDLRIPKREIVNAIFYINKHCCTWRGLPLDLPNWLQTARWTNTKRFALVGPKGLVYSVRDAARVVI